MTRQIHIVKNDDDPLSRFHVFDPPLAFGSTTFSSVEQARWYIILLQQGESRLATCLRHNDQLKKYPRKIMAWIDRNEVAIAAEWIFRSAQIYADILQSQIQLDSSPIRAALSLIRNSVEDSQNINFVIAAGTNEYVWSSGIRTSALLKNPDKFPGFNVYGDVLNGAMNKYLKHDMTPFKAGFYDYINTDMSNNQNNFKTVLILSDSQCRLVESIHEGEVYPISGGKCSDIANLIRVRHLNLLNFEMIIINCGINPAQTPYNEWLEDWNPLGEILHQTLQSPSCPAILFNCPMPHPSVQSVANYSGFIEARLSNTAVKIVNWSTMTDCPFRVTHPKHFAPFDQKDGFHVSQTGFRELWKKWCDVLYLLFSVDYKLTSEFKTLKRNNLNGPRI